jgi:hypothetical protein
METLPMIQRNPRAGFTLFSKWSIALFSIVCTYFCGALMLAYNLRQTGKTKSAWVMVLSSLVGYAVLLQIVKRFNPGSIIEFLVPNIIIGLILAFPIWEYVFPDLEEYRQKSLLTPIIATVAVWGGILLLNLLMAK